MNITSRLAALLAACALAACGGGSDDAPPPAPPPAPAPTPGADRIEPLDTAALPRHMAKLAQPQAAARSQWPQGMAPALVDLGPLPLVKSAGSQNKGVAQQIGVAREVAATAQPAGVASRWHWQPLAGGGQVAALAFDSANAQAVRLGVRVDALPPGTVLRFFGADRSKVVEVTAQQAAQLRQTNASAGVLGDAARMVWGPDTAGAQAVLEVQIPAGADPGAVQLAVPQLSHLFTHAGLGWALPKRVMDIGDADRCEQDVMCQPELDPISRAVAKLVFTDGGTTYLCTGTLLNDTRNSQTPHLLTSGHCINGQEAASSLISYWFFRSARCNGSPDLDGNATSLSGGARLLYTDAALDTTLLRLNEPAPANVVFAGSYYGAQATPGLAVLGVHHPGGDLQKYSDGAIAGYGLCRNSTCYDSDAAQGTMLTVRWSLGTTEPGSSGSALFARSGSTRYVVGALHGGTTSCQNPGGVDFYGRLERSFAAGLRPFLAP